MELTKNSHDPPLSHYCIINIIFLRHLILHAKVVESVHSLKQFFSEKSRIMHYVLVEKWLYMYGHMIFIISNNRKSLDFHSYLINKNLTDKQAFTEI